MPLGRLALALAMCLSIACRPRSTASGTSDFSQWDDQKHPEYFSICGPQSANPPPGGGSTGQTAEQKAAATAFKAIVEAKDCLRCHASPAQAEDAGTDFSYILDRDRMVSEGLINLAEPSKSQLYKKVNNNSMPQDGTPLSAEQKAQVLSWITAGAPAFDGSGGGGGDAVQPDSSIAFVTEADKVLCMLKDLEQVPAAQRAFTRYLTLTHHYNDKIDETTLAAEREAIAKALNSLSFKPEIAKPVVIDPASSILRIDLRSYGWNEAKWQSVFKTNPYGIVFNEPEAKKLASTTQSALPQMRGDWFVFAVTKPPLYHDLLGLPDTSQALEQKLQVDLLGNIDQFKVDRVGFVESDVSQNNRMIERHKTSVGAYWQSYDFASSTGLGNLKANPFGPCVNVNVNFTNLVRCNVGDAQLKARKVFRHAGGEIIFNLPNGLQAYLLTDAAGKRLDQGPNNIVTDPSRPDKLVTNGVSCMGCHVKGMLRHEDEVLPAVQATTTFVNVEVSRAKKLYPSAAKMNALFQEDEDRFQKAMQALGSDVDRQDPVRVTVLRFERELDISQVAFEFGLTEAEFRERLAHAPNLGAEFAGILTDGKVKRDTFNDLFALGVTDLDLGTPITGSNTPPPNNPPPNDPPPNNPPPNNPPPAPPPGSLALKNGHYTCTPVMGWGNCDAGVDMIVTERQALNVPKVTRSKCLQNPGAYSSLDYICTSGGACEDSGNAFPRWKIESETSFAWLKNSGSHGGTCTFTSAEYVAFDSPQTCGAGEKRVLGRCWSHKKNSDTSGEVDSSCDLQCAAKNKICDKESMFQLMKDSTACSLVKSAFGYTADVYVPSFCGNKFAHMCYMSAAIPSYPMYCDSQSATENSGTTTCQGRSSFCLCK